MFESFESQHQRVSVILVALSVASAAGAALVGVDDNPPGIALAVVSGTLLVTAFVHHWRSPKRFLVLAAGAIGLSVAAVGILILIDISMTAGRIPEPVVPAVDTGGNALALVLAFLVVPAMLVGLAGSVTVWLVGKLK
jgi:hypothetical protein